MLFDINSTVYFEFYDGLIYTLNYSSRMTYLHNLFIAKVHCFHWRLVPFPLAHRALSTGASCPFHWRLVPFPLAPRALSTVAWCPFHWRLVRAISTGASCPFHWRLVPFPLAPRALSTGALCPGINHVKIIRP